MLLNRAIGHPNNIPMFPPENKEKMESEKSKTMPIHDSKEPLIPETLCAFRGFEGISDNEAAEIILSIRAFATLVFDYCKEKENKTLSDITENNQSNYKQAA